jgi:SlyX protein
LTTDRITELEEQIAHLTRTVDDLSTVVARQDKALDLATKRLSVLLEREATREYDDGGSVAIADVKPPHW